MNTKNLLQSILVSILFVYYLLNLLLLIPTVSPLNSGISLLIKQNTLSNLLSFDQPFDLNQTYIIDFFHKKDPDIQSALGDRFLKNNMDTQAFQKYQDVILYDPKNEDNQEKYTKLLLKMKRNDLLIVWLYQYAREYLPQHLYSSINLIPFQSINLLNYEKELLTLFDDTLSHEIRFARLLFKIGFDQITTDVFLAKELLSTSVELNPGTSQYHVELASFYMHILKDEVISKKILQQCIKNIYAKIHCEEILSSVIPPPGTFLKEIMNP